MRILIAVAVALAAVLAWALGPRGRWNRFAASNGARDGDARTTPTPAPTPTQTRAPTSSGNLSAMTRAELYEMAKRLGIPGRSAMNKDQLVRAINARARA